MAVPGFGSADATNPKPENPKPKIFDHLNANDPLGRQICPLMHVASACVFFGK